MSPTRVIVAGDRHWHCKELADRVVGRLIERYGAGLVIVHGAAPGVDSTFADACNWQGATHEPHPADWEGRGKAAGPIRNQEMVDLGASFAIAVHRNFTGSKGTKDCATRCQEAGIPVYLIAGDDARPVRLELVWPFSRGRRA